MTPFQFDPERDEFELPPGLADIDRRAKRRRAIKAAALWAVAAGIVTAVIWAVAP
jgi:ferric-dicitrate binding protein FerR (iron transport regulator)